MSENQIIMRAILTFITAVLLIVSGCTVSDGIKADRRADVAKTCIANGGSWNSGNDFGYGNCNKDNAAARAALKDLL